MLLIVSNTGDVTADFLERELLRAGVSWTRLDTDEFLSNAKFTFTPGNPQLYLGNEPVSPSAIAHVWYRRPMRLTSVTQEDGPEEKFRMEEWAEALEGWMAHIPVHRWMNHPSRNAVASSKPLQLTVAREIGLLVPETCLTNDPATARLFVESHRRVIAKPLASGYVERHPTGSDSLIYTNLVSKADLQSATEDLKSCPTLFQEGIDKTLDVRVTVVDGAVHAKGLIVPEPHDARKWDIRRENMAGVEYCDVEMPLAITRCIGGLMSYFRLRFGALDFVVDQNDQWFFLEINPNGQWAWLDQSAGSNIAASFVDAFTNPPQVTR